jgi:hypothetical protein
MTLFEPCTRLYSIFLTRIYGAHKIFDKKTGGYFNGQCLMFLLLVTDTVTLPVGVRFYRPDPKYQAWDKENKRLKKAGIKAAKRPKAPKPDPGLSEQNRDRTCAR